MKILVGSSALKNYIDIKREPKDVDYFSDMEVEPNSEGPKVEVFFHQNILSYFGNVQRIATLDELYTIKISHIFWDLKNDSWEKHCYDIMQMKRNGASLLPVLFERLYPIWEALHGPKKANLNAMPEDFFNKQVHRIYDHDSIHTSIAYYDEPLFKRILKDNHPVAVKKSKFDDLSFEDKLRCVREEVYATALERQIIPSNYTASPRVAYQWALKKTITSFSKGWFPLFIVENLEELWKPDIDYVARHKSNMDKLIKLEN